MSQSELKSSLPDHRRSRGWSQAELARRARTSRAEVSAIETGRHMPSAFVAIALATALGCSVEDIFSIGGYTARREDWAWKPERDSTRFWKASVGGRTLLYPAEPTALGTVRHDGRHSAGRSQLVPESEPERTLVVAGCDPAVRILESELARSAGFRMLAFTRSSQAALRLLKDGLVHAAGVHLSDATGRRANESETRNALGRGYKLLRITRWQEGIAVSRDLGIRSVRSALGAKLRWVGREEGSGARRCLERLLQDGKPTARVVRNTASDHRAVAMAVRSGFAQAGVCIRLCAEESGLDFLRVQTEDYDLCYPTSLEGDARLAALVRAVQSASYRHAIGALEGYDAATTGEIQDIR